MAINEARVKEGTLTLGGTGGTGGTEFACQATNVRVTPSHDESGDEVETLCGDKLPADVKTSWSLAGTSIQDFDSPEGFVQFSIEHNLEAVEFTWEPNANGTSVTGTVNVRAVELGGDVNVRLTTEFEWPCQGDPTFTWPPTTPLTTTATAEENGGAGAGAGEANGGVEANGPVEESEYQPAP